ncbi:hypothetical protein EHQ58_13525 [Leptospira ognonensis]|uniref:Lipoprotein n=1 Tax=Leptospira ognonensis TaxID=2484945 RepID=A0A4R9JYN3_9LEPT|nr:hypothetical protein [Leptospira ognonensis]TGL57311.1 hypothetical protein EHQ58_13525 [Leptospira ognonensis]
MLKKILSLALGLFLVSGIVFCKKEEPAPAETTTVENVKESAEKVLTDAEKKAMEAAKAAEAAATKKATEGVDAAKDAMKTKLP